MTTRVKPDIGAVSPAFDRRMRKYEGDGVISSGEAKALRDIAREAVKADGFDLSNSVVFADEFARLAGGTTDKKSTSSYLNNAADEFGHLQLIRGAGPAVRAALSEVENTEEWAGILGPGKSIDSRSYLGSPNAAVAHIVEFKPARFITALGAEWYAEKIAQLLDTSPALAELKPVINLINVQGYDGFNVAQLLKNPGDREVPPLTEEATRVPPNALPGLSYVIGKLKDRGRVIVPEAESLRDTVNSDLSQLDTLDKAKAFKAGLTQIMPYADHRVTQELLKEALSQTEKAIALSTVLPDVRATVAGLRGELPNIDAKEPAIVSERIDVFMKRDATKAETDAVDARLRAKFPELGDRLWVRENFG